jgi:hypothetical protein
MSHGSIKIVGIDFQVHHHLLIARTSGRAISMH